MENDKKQGPGAATGFAGEFVDCWRRLPNKGIFLALLGAWLLLFQFLGTCTFGYVDTTSLMYWLYNAYHRSEGNEDHGYLIPFVVLALFWWKREKLLALPNRLWPPALILVAVALLFHILGYRIQQERLSVIGFFGGIYALMGLAWGWAWMRTSFFPFFLFAFSMPFGGAAEPVTFPMRLLVTRIVEIIAHFLSLDVIREGTQLFNASHSYSYEVAAACSGIRSIIAILCLATIFGFMNFEQTWKRLVMMASAFPLAILGNVIRMMCIIVAAEVSGQTTGNFVHENFLFSLMPYLPAIIGVMLLGHWLRERPKHHGLLLEAKPV